LGSALSVLHRLLVVNDGERGAVEEGIGEDGGAHAGDGVVFIGRFNWVRNTNDGIFDGEREEGAEIRGVVVAVVPTRGRVGRQRGL